MLRITLLNPKGGSGKSTLATNLASHFAGLGHNTVLFDYDAQGSSTRWLELRPPELPPIYGVPAYRDAARMTRSWQLRVPSATDRVVVDTPASVEGPRLDDLIRRSDRIVVPVLSSPVDVAAFVNFARTLARFPRIRSGDVRVAIIANRVRRRTRYFKTLRSAIQDVELEARLEYVTALRDTQHYVQAGAYGCGIGELDSARTGPDLDEWGPLLSWLGGSPDHGGRRDAPDATGTGNDGMSGAPRQGRLNLDGEARNRNAA